MAATSQTLLTTEAEGAARDTGWVRRCCQCRGTTLVQTQVWDWLQQPRAPVDSLVEVATDLGIAVSAAALDQRFNAPGTHCRA